MTTKTLDELEGVVWERPDYDSTLVQTCFRLRSKPVGEFSAEDLRIMIGQDIGLPFLIPLALKQLEANPWVSGVMYPGDLLAITIRCNFSWDEQPDLRSRVRAVITRALGEISRFRYVDLDGIPNLDVPGEELAAQMENDLRRSFEHN